MPNGRHFDLPKVKIEFCSYCGIVIPEEHKDDCENCGESIKEEENRIPGEFTADDAERLRGLT